MKKSLLCIMAVFLVLISGCGEKRTAEVTGSQMVCGSHDYEWINPLRDAYGEIDPLLFDGLMRRDGTGATVPALAESWAYDAATHTYTFPLRAGVTWHDGEPLCPDDVKFTIEAILDPKNRSLQRPYFEDVREITAVDERTVRIRLAAHNEAFPDYMTQPILPAHLLAGKDLTKTGFFRHPIGAGIGKNHGDILPQIVPTLHGDGAVLRYGEDDHSGKVRIPIELFCRAADKLLRLKIIELDSIGAVILKDLQEIRRESLRIERLRRGAAQGVGIGRAEVVRIDERQRLRRALGCEEYEGACGAAERE